MTAPGEETKARAEALTNRDETEADLRRLVEEYGWLGTANALSALQVIDELKRELTEAKRLDDAAHTRAATAEAQAEAYRVALARISRVPCRDQDHTRANCPVWMAHDALLAATSPGQTGEGK